MLVSEFQKNSLKGTGSNLLVYQSCLAVKLTIITGEMGLKNDSEFIKSWRGRDGNEEGKGFKVQEGRTKVSNPRRSLDSGVISSQII